MVSRAQMGKQISSAPSSRRKFAKVMREWKTGKLTSSSGAKVTSQKQAKAIAASEARMAANNRKRTSRRHA